MTRPVPAALALSLVAFLSSTAHANEPPRLRLHLEANSSDVTLERRADVVSFGFQRLELWDTVCSAPCDQLIDQAAVYRIGGAGILPSDDLVLPPGDRVSISAKGGRIAKLLGGIALVTGGSVVLAGGAALAGIALLAEPPNGSAEQGLLICAGISAAASAVAYVFGIPMLASNKTQVEIQGSSEPDLASR